MAENYILTIESLTRMYEEKEVLSNIWLAFYPGAKIAMIRSSVLLPDPLLPSTPIFAPG